MKLEFQKSYRWLFLAYAVLALAGALLSGMIYGRPIGAFPVMAALALFLLVSQLRSGLALDGRWRAVYRKGTWPYVFAITANTVLLIFCTALAIDVFRNLR